MTNIDTITAEIETAQQELAADKAALARIEGLIHQIGDIEERISGWRIEQARMGEDTLKLPDNLASEQAAFDVHEATKASLLRSIAHREAEISRMGKDLERARAIAFDAAWQVISAECDRLADRLAEQQAAYTETARQLFGLVQTARQGEHLSPRAQRLYAPTFWDKPRTSREQAEGMDMQVYRQQIEPFVNQAREWRSRLASDQQAATPF